MKTRVIKKNGKFIPQFRFVSKIWMEFLAGVFEGDVKIHQFDNREDAVEFIRKEINNEH